MQKSNRLKRELAGLMQNPTEGICCYPRGDSMDVLRAVIMGPHGSPYQGGVFELEIEIPDRYPFVPPAVKFLTPVYHPNIDNNGLICLDLLKAPPQGGWKATISLKNLLTAIQLLMGSPNIDDPLMMEVAEEYRFNRPEYERKAREYTHRTKRNKPEGFP